MPKKPRRGKKQSKLSRILGVDRTKHNVVMYLHKELSSREIENIVPSLAKHRDFSKQINLSLDKDFTDFYDITLPFLELDKNLAWCIGVLKYHSDKLTEFGTLEEKLQRFILNENYADALDTLDTIDNICGISLYSIGLRSSIYKISGQEKEHSNFISKIIDNKKLNGFFKTICKYSMDRYDESSLNITSAESTKKQILRTMDKDFSSFLIYRITPKDYLSELQINYNIVLEHEKRCSIIDIYKAIIEYIEIESVRNIELSSSIKDIIVKINKITKNTITNNISRFNLINTESINYKFNPEIIDAYTRGEYEHIVEKLTNINKYYTFSTFEIIVKSIARYGVNPFKGFQKKIVDDLCSIILKKESYYTCYYSILNICYAYRGIPWFQELQLFISKESRFIGEKLNNYLAKIVAINAEEDTPRKLSFFDIDNIQSYNSFMNNNYPNSITLDLFKLLSSLNKSSIVDDFELLDIDTHRYKKYLAIHLLEKGNITEAINLLEDVIDNSTIIDSFDGLKFLVNAYITNGLPEKAIKIFVDHCLDNKNNVLVFDIQKIAESAKELVNTTKDIEVPIALEIYTKFVNNDYESALRVCLDSFISNNGLNNPIELINVDLGFKENKINYFLENVCTIRNMKLTLLFDSKIEIENCRIKICNYLIDNNISKDVIVEELKSITKEHVFRKAIKQVDNSRIYVDVTAFKDKLSKNFKTIFERFCELKKQDYSNYEDELSLRNLSKALSKALNDIDANIFSSASSLHLQDVTFNEKNRTFHKLISMIRDEFTFGEKGLNSYLSTRIRHGVLPTELRKAAQSEKLWLVQDGTDIIRFDTYWRQKLPSINHESIQEFTISLKKFTTLYESVIDEINDRWLQIISLDQDISNIKSGVNKSQALFNYSISTTETYIIQLLIENDSFNDLIDIILSWLWNRTDSNLLSIRTHITDNAFEKFKDVYSSLEIDILNLKLDSEDKQTLLVSLGRAKENVRASLVAISSWFNRSTTNHIDFFELDIAIDIAAKSTNTNIIIKNDNDFKLKGRYLSSFVDILYNLFDNSVNNCNLPLDELQLMIEIEVEHTDLIIKVSNNCSPVNIEVEEKKLSYYRDAYGDAELMNKASQEEGRTGIFKIYNTIDKDFGVQHSNSFGFTSETNFETIIKISKLMEVASYESSNC
ncbi:hypothetical protein AB6F89_20045 [Providencia hangzhouensis]|uniref:hypothetical protein n=1 Tax=Providencia hangzhouensis TaxID=3031799 RepID=UPI0034DD55A1